MNMFAKPLKVVTAPFLGAEHITSGEITLAHEDVARLKSHQKAAADELAVVTGKLTRLRAFEKELLASENAVQSKMNAVTRMLKAKERMLFDLEQDGGAI